jgi:hypothetical protein
MMELFPFSAGNASSTLQKQENKKPEVNAAKEA